MLVRGISREDLEAAVGVASRALGNELEAYDVTLANKRGDAWNVRLKVRDLDEPGARLHLHMYYLGHAPKPRRSGHACGHAVGAFMAACFERNPHARSKTGFVSYRDAWDFLSSYRQILDRNIGSQMLPIHFGDSCTCEDDEVPGAESLAYVGYVHAGIPGKGVA